ncbi:CRISPR-associated protein, Cse3 family [Pasteurella testudinis DSM 23072]|uniref:CRISPR-associated protein, Cse3 family n=1 Tax=Pasteurella testudinis DSM 23072 TaxID=1122938 RepID=A0A1W1UR52_9PAST|nr:type I-E CRISPR-associated protein Cas6/Cse3/CasE [Pasteurella testudinis]SMB83536.1 CRISPR-associated protein, Cse3 family [Pasteurella testudinis DSM 23072]SUB51056.1 CRISPR-associated protein Cas6/Cse3/CasE, subtype I-E/ECOLI [Pasteurella testudinis]
MNNSLYASVLKLGRQDIKQFSIKDQYGLHKVIYSLFDKDELAEKRRFLFCEKGSAFDLYKKEYVKQVILLSQQPPKSVIGNYQVNIQTKSIPETFLNHRNYRFEIRMNVAKRINRSKKIIPLKNKEEILLWFLQKNADWGFQADPRMLQINAHNVMCFSKNEKTVTLNAVTFQGVLQVQNHQLFSNSFIYGIGRGRSFGLGLLQLVPLSDNLFSI